MSRICRLSILSHGATTLGRAPSFASDESLLDGEAEKASRLIPFLPGNVPVISGPECRTCQTAAIFSSNYAIDDEFRDISFGRWAGKTLVEVGTEEPDAVRVWIADVDASPHGGESISTLFKRVSHWMNGQVASEGHRLIVTHPAVVRAMIMAVLEAPPQTFWKVDVEPLSLTDLRSDGRRWALRSFGRILAG